jgi:bifunctional non-homologous end joining protein LigD
MPQTERNPRGISPAKQKKPASRSAGFIEPMLLLKTDSLPDDSRWLYELKLDGYRAIAFKRNGTVHLRSRNDNDFNVRNPVEINECPFANLPEARSGRWARG